MNSMIEISKIVKHNYSTKRLILMTPVASLANSLTSFYIKNKDFLKPFEPERSDIFFEKTTQKRILQQEADQIKKGVGLRFYIAKRESPKTIIGTVALNNILNGAFLSCTVGYKLDKTELGKGYMTEALEKVIDIAFTDLKLHRIEANIMPENDRSIRVVERLGFRYEGLAKKYLKINGRWRDHVHMVILNDDPSV